MKPIHPKEAVIRLACDPRGNQRNLIRTLGVDIAMDPKYSDLHLLHALTDRGQSWGKKPPALLLDEGFCLDLPSLFLPLARGGYHGLYIECKCGKDTVDPYKNGWIEELTAQGYCHHFLNTFPEAVEFIKDYHDGKIQKP